jgi:hypothetical protein
LRTAASAISTAHEGTRSACDDRISVYPAAPFRLAISLYALTIARSHRDFAAWRLDRREEKQTA